MGLKADSGGNFELWADLSTGGLLILSETDGAALLSLPGHRRGLLRRVAGLTARDVSAAGVDPAHLTGPAHPAHSTKGAASG
jgi:hypothetical protein